MTTELRLVTELYETIGNRKKNRDDVARLYARLWHLQQPLTVAERVQLCQTFTEINKAIETRWSPQALNYIQKKALSGRESAGGCSEREDLSSGAMITTSTGEIRPLTFETICATLGLEDFVLQ